MSATHQHTDAFGFTEAACKISSVDLTGTANHVWECCRRSAALLRTLHYRLLHEDQKNVSLSDVEALVELALSALPDPDGEAFDDFDQYSLDANQTMRTLLHRQQALTAVLDAMEIAANPNATLTELNVAATEVYSNTSLLQDGARRWERFSDLIKARHLHIVWHNFGPGLPPRPEIHTAESLKAQRKIQRKMQAFTQAVNQMAGQLTDATPVERKTRKSR